jgi:hypothetical protein
MEDRSLFLPQPIPVARSILWKPLPDSFHLLARVLEGAQAYKIFISQDTLLDIEDRIRTSRHQHVLGLLLGNLYECTETGERFVIVTAHLKSTQQLDEENDPISPELWESLQADLRGRSGHVLGWYRSHSRVGRRLEPPDARVQERYFPQPWQSVLLLNVDERRITGGLFLVEKRSGRSYLSPFYELLDSESVRVAGVKRTCVSWYNYVTEDTVSPFAGWERETVPAPVVSDSEGGGASFFSRLIDSVRRAFRGFVNDDRPVSVVGHARGTQHSEREERARPLERLRELSRSTEPEIPRVPARDVVPAEESHESPALNADRESEPVPSVTSRLILSSPIPRRPSPVRLHAQPAPSTPAPERAPAAREVSEAPARPAVAEMPRAREQLPRAPTRQDLRARLALEAAADTEPEQPVEKAPEPAPEEDFVSINVPKSGILIPAAQQPEMSGYILLPANFFADDDRRRRRRRTGMVGGVGALVAVLALMLTVRGDESQTGLSRAAVAADRRAIPSAAANGSSGPANAPASQPEAAAGPAADTLLAALAVHQDSVERALAAYQVLDGDFAEKQVDCAALSQGYRELRRLYFAFIELYGLAQPRLNQEQGAKYTFLATKLMEADELFLASRCTLR